MQLSPNNSPPNDQCASQVSVKEHLSGATALENMQALTKDLPYLNPSYEGVALTAEQAATAMQPYGGPVINLSFNMNMLVVCLVFAATAALQWASLLVANRLRVL